jgi:hypothetical protein
MKKKGVLMFLISFVYSMKILNGRRDTGSDDDPRPESFGFTPMLFIK